MSGGAEIARRPPEQELVARVREPVFREQVAMALPPSVTVDHFIRLTTTALLANPDVAKLDHQTVLRALVQSAAAGLVPDGKQAAIVGRGGKAVFQPMIAGLVKTAAEYGWTMKTKAIYANDEFSYSEEPESIRHEVRIDRDRGDLIGAYATATHKDGRRLIRVMTQEQIAKRRAIATTQNVWEKWTAEMYEKTAGRDLFADLPLAESDLERNRIRVLLEDTVVEPGDAQALLYGPTEARPELPASDPLSTPAVSQTDGAAQEINPPGKTAPEDAPSDTGNDDEPSLVEDEPRSNFVSPVAVVDDPSVQAAANQAAMYHPPNGAHKEMTLGEILAVGPKGESWFRNRLDVVEQPTEYVSALFNFTRVYAPELYHAAIARREAADTDA